MTNTLLDAIERNGIKIGSAQAAVLRDVAGGGKVACWSARDDIAQADIVILDEAPKGFQIDSFCHALPREATVVIPYSENAQFDLIKSRLNCYGTIGASAPDAPHQVWWGGLHTARGDGGVDGLRNAHIVSCVRRQTHEERDALSFCKSLMAMGISYTIDLSDPHVYRDDRSTIRSQTLLRVWDSGNKPLIWLDPMGDIDLSTIDPTLTGADFAAIYEPGEGFSTTFLYFGRSRAAHELLMHWNKLCEEFPHLPADFVLDTAWAMISAQRMLVTRWLSADSYRSVLAGARANPIAPSLVENEPIECRNSAFRYARRAARIGAPEPQCIVNGRFSECSPITFVTSSEFNTAREVASLMEDVLGAFDRFSGGFSSLAVVVCRDVKEAADTIETLGDSWVLYTWPGTHIEHDLFSHLSRLRNRKGVSYLGLLTSDKKAQTPTGRDLAMNKSRIVFGRGRDFFDNAAVASKRPLKLVK